MGTKKTLVGLLAFLFFVPSLTLAAAAPPYNPPFGLWDIPSDQFGTLPFNLTGHYFRPPRDTPATLIATLDAARASHTHLIIGLVNFAQLEETPLGNFSLAHWQERYNYWCPADAAGTPRCVNLQPYVADGTLMGLNLFEYDPDLKTGERRSPTLDQIRQVAAYVKTLWPYLPLAVDTSRPCLLTDERWSHADLDLVLISLFTEKRTDFTRGDALLNKDVACARQAGLAFTLGPNPFGGLQNGVSSTSLASFRHYAEYSLMYPGKIGTLVWRWWPSDSATVSNRVDKTFANFWSESVNPGIGAAMHEIEVCAANPSPGYCPAGRPGG